ncbi:MAG: thermonuclease family protein [bacterium]
MRRLLFILGILILFSKESLASLSDFLYLELGTQTIGTVTSIIDGDTIKVKLPATETTVRLLSIDTPELPNDPFAQAAQNLTTQQLLNQPIKLFYSNNPAQQIDKYGRLLGVVYKPDKDEIFNITLLEQGLAVRMFIFNDIIQFHEWEDVEINTRQQRLNIWSNINSKGVFINEINPNPYPESDNEAEFVELYNNASTGVDVGNWRLICIYNEVVIPPGTIIPANGYLIIARTNTTRFKQIYPDTPPEAIIIDGGDNLVLQNSYTPTEDLVVHLKAQDNSYQDSLTYNLAWDNGYANGSGKTLERKSIFITNVGDSEVDGVDDANWDASIDDKGTPGKSNSVSHSNLDVASWIISCQRDTGAICTDQSKTKIIPYMANIAAIGLLEEGGYEGSVKAWIDWYFTHLEAWGTIYDYKVENGTEISLSSAEAEDRNLGTFFTLLKKYYQATLDVEYLKGHQLQMDIMGNYILFALQDFNDYLIWTDSLWQKKLLINNAEGYHGLKDLASLYFDLTNEVNQRDLYLTGAEVTREAIKTELWNEAQGWYYWEKDNIGNKTACNWATIYPDAISHLYTILNNVNLPESSISSTLYNTFNVQQPNWINPAPGTDSYCEMGYAGSLMADTTKVESYQDSITTNVINQGYPTPWNCKDAGFYLLMQNRLIELDEIQPVIDKPKELCLNFINSDMLTPFGGIQAQFDNISFTSGTQGVNHEVTSEATSQALLYAALTKNKTFFDEQFEILDNHISNTYNILVWKLTPNGEWWTNDSTYANAAIDDLRTIRALLLAYDAWGDENYRNYAKSLAQGLKEHNIQNGQLRESFTWEPQWTSQEVFLSYIDLCTMQRLAELYPEWENILQTNKKIIIERTATSKLYYYMFTNGNYYGEDYGDNISIIHAGWIAENLARYWKLTGDQDCRLAAENFLGFVKNEYESYGKIFGKYDIIKGTHTVEYEDIAVYSIIARVAFILGEFEFAKTLLNNKILTQQNKDIKSKTVGCFGYDFDNPDSFVSLEALLAKVELEAKEEYLIRGKITSSDNKPMEGVLLTLAGTTFAIFTTDSTGEYKFTGEPNGTYTITPYKEGYKFKPETEPPINPLNRHCDNVNFTGFSGKITYVSPISGTIGTPIAIKGEGLDQKEDIRISFGEITTVVIITSNNFGEFITTFTAPIQPSGSITISAYGSSSKVIGINYFFLRALDHFTIGTINTQIAGEEFEISIRALDARNDIFEYCGTASLTDETMRIFPGATTPFVSGTWLGTVTIDKIGTTTIKVEAENKIGISNPFLITPAPINKLVFITTTQSIPAGSSTNLVVFQTQDKFGNLSNTQANVKIQLLSTSLKGKFSLTQSPWIETNTITLTSGTNTGGFYYLDTLAGTHNITIKEEPSLNWVAGTQEVIVTPASLDGFEFNTITTQQAGKEFQIEIKAIDAFNNMVDFTGSAILTEIHNTISPHLATFTAGMSIVSATIRRAGTTSISAEFDTKRGTSNIFMVTPDQLHHITIGTITSQRAGTEFTIKIEVLDMYENIATYSDTAYLEAGTKSIFPATIIFTQGVWEGTITITKMGTTAISVLVAGKRGTSNPFWISPNVLDHFVFNDISSQEVGIEFEIMITAMDAYENIATYTGIAYLQDISQTILPTKTSTFTNGIWQGTVAITYATTTRIIAFVDNKRGTSNPFYLKPGHFHHFSFATITDQVAGKEFEITIIAKDIYENNATYSDKAILQDASNTLIGTQTDNFIAGICSSTITITKAGTTTVFATTNGKTGTSNTFYVNPDVLDKIVISPNEIELGVGSEYKFEADGFDKYGNELEELYTWNTVIGSLNPTSGTYTLFKATTIPTIGTLTATYNTIIGYATITLQIGTLSYIVITPANATITIGGSQTFTTKGYDKYKNEKFIEGGTWEIENWMGSIDPITGTQTNFIAGIKAGKGNIKYQLNQIQATATITILPATHTYFKIGTISSPQTAGASFTITITACDYYDNIIEDYTGGVRLNYSEGKIYPDELTNFKLGVCIGTITIENASENAIITVQDINTPAIKGTSNSFNICHNIFYQFKIRGIEPTHIINSEIGIVVTAEDIYGNIITDYNGTFSLTDDTQTIYPEVGTCTSGEFKGSVTISKAKPNIKITVSAAGKTGISNLFTTLIDSKAGGKVTGDVGDEKTAIEISKEALLTDFYITIDPTPEALKTDINIANSSLSQDPTSRGITSSLHLFQAYDKDNKPIEVGTNSFILISLPYPDKNPEDGFVDYPNAKIKEETLKIYVLKNRRWAEVKNYSVHPIENIVSAPISHFGVYMLIAQIIPETIDILKVYPNPFKPIRGDSEIIFDGLPQNTNIRIYDISGSLIKEIENITTGSYNWDVKDACGQDVASGIYIYIVSYDDKKKIGKIAVIR